MEEAFLVRKTETSPVWEHFTKHSEGGKCNYCGKMLKSHNSTSNLMNHLRAQHRDKWDLIKHHYPRWSNEPEKGLRAKASKNTMKCTGLDHTTGELIEYDSDAVILSPSVVSLRQRSRRPGKSPVWQHFTRHALGGKCNYCGVVFRSYSSTSNLMNHLRNIHPDKWATMKHLYPKRDLHFREKRSQSVKRKAVKYEDEPEDERTVVKQPKLIRGSPVWKYFTKLNNDGLNKCNLCGKILKSFNSTSSLRNHMKRHPNEWMALQNADSIINNINDADVVQEFKSEFIDDPMEYVEMTDDPMVVYEQEPVASTSSKKKRSQEQVPDPAIDSIVRFVVKGDMPMNITENSEFRHLLLMHNADYDLCSQIRLRNTLNDKYNEVVAAIRDQLEEVTSVSLGVGEYLDGVNGRNFMAITCHFIRDSLLRSAMISFEELTEGMTNEQLQQRIETVCEFWHIHKAKVESFTVTGETPLITNTLTSMFGKDKLVYCFGHALSVIAKKPFETMPEVQSISDAIKQITCHLKMGEEILVDDYLEGQEFWDLIYTTPTSWRGLFQQMENFIKFSAKIEACFLERTDVPSTLTDETLHEIKDLLKVYKPLIGVIDELCLEELLLASKVIPIVQCLLASLEDTWPETHLGVEAKQMIVDQINAQFSAMEDNETYALSTLLDPRFKRNYFKKALARDNAIAKLKEMITVCNDPFETETGTEIEGSIWKFHMSFVENQSSSAPHPITLYLSSKVSPLLETDPIGYFASRHTELRNGAEKLLIPTATSAPPKKIFSESGNTIHSNWASLPIHDLRRLMLLKSVLND